MSLLELKNVYKIYGELHALDNVSLKVEKRRMGFHHGAFRFREKYNDEYHWLYG